MSENGGVLGNSDFSSSRWQMNQWNPAGGVYNQNMIDPAWFEKEDMLMSIMLFTFDACYTYSPISGG